jgi:hypothetical protein
MREFVLHLRLEPLELTAPTTLSVVVAAAVWAFAIGYWYIPRIGGKTFFNGPRTQDGNTLDYDASELPSEEYAMRRSADFGIDAKKLNGSRNGEGEI